MPDQYPSYELTNNRLAFAIFRENHFCNLFRDKEIRHTYRRPATFYTVKTCLMDILIWVRLRLSDRRSELWHHFPDPQPGLAGVHGKPFGMNRWVAV